MGCDIHAHFEIKVDNEWLHYSQPQIDRNYRLFEFMAGIRGEVNKAICEPKGLPADINKTTALSNKYWDSDGHSHSWLDAAQISKVFDFHMSQAKDFSKKLLFERKDWGYLFGNGWATFEQYRSDYPSFIQDIRLVFWFDN